jgi:CDP-6-deoxy-D-xylo-4-hexulose-3-dehydrase
MKWKKMTKTNTISEFVKDLYEERYRKTVVSKIPLSIPTFGPEEIAEALDSLVTAKVTMGEKVKTFEESFAKYLGAKEAIMVNSGSSANLLALSILSNPELGEKRIMTEDEVIVPATTWSTSIFPIINIGATPVLVDINIKDFSIKVDDVEEAITSKTKAIMPVHLLGFPCNMNRTMAIAKKYNLFVIEDACEAHGAQFGSKKVGTFGDLGTFSFFFSHHISTIEGGMVVTNKESYSELARILRAHGWIRDAKHKENIISAYPELDPRFLFINMGFNMRPTEIQGAFGIHQIRKLEKFIEVRRENARYWNEVLKKHSDYFVIHEEEENTRAVWFGYPITLKPQAPFSKKDLTRYLESKGIETRPITAGNMDEQPAIKLFNYRKIGHLTNSRYILRNSFFIGNHHGIGEREREYVAKTIHRFIRMKTK